MERVRLNRPTARLAGRLLAQPVARYIRRERNRLASRTISLYPCIRDEFQPYFERRLLEETRMIASESLQLSAVPFERLLRRVGVSFPSTELVSAITLDDVVAVRERPSPRLLFHELVHVVQFRLLGVRDFARLYVTGFLREGSYDAIPLERCASILEVRFASGVRFCVEAVVSSWVEGDLF